MGRQAVRKYRSTGCNNCLYDQNSPDMEGNVRLPSGPKSPQKAPPACSSGVGISSTGTYYV